MFKKPEQLRDNRRAPKWRTDQKFEEKNEKRDRFNEAPALRFEKNRGRTCY